MRSRPRARSTGLLTIFLFPPSGALWVAMKAGTEAGRAGKSDSNSDKLQERSFQVGEVKLVKFLINQMMVVWCLTRKWCNWMFLVLFG